MIFKVGDRVKTVSNLPADTSCEPLGDGVISSIDTYGQYPIIVGDTTFGSAYNENELELFDSNRKLKKQVYKIL